MTNEKAGRTVAWNMIGPDRLGFLTVSLAKYVTLVACPIAFCHYEVESGPMCLSRRLSASGSGLLLSPGSTVQMNQIIMMFAL